jgi:lipid-A-disaccharide synthase
MKYYIIAGEASGDLHGSNLVKALKVEDPQAQIRAWGGDLMEAAGAEVVKHYRDLAFMGFLEVVLNLRAILRNIKFCKEDILRFRPDALILIDYPGFNLRIAKWAKGQGLKVFYYISPQLWAWHSSRVHDIKKSVDRMFVILPFEEEFYRRYDYEVDFVGHPLLDVIDNYPERKEFRKENGLSEQPIIALLPGSRRQEISRMLEIMLRVVPEFPDHQFVIAGAPSIPVAFYEDILEKNREAGERVKLVRNRTYDLLQHSRAALVTSGTATLETALFNVPQIVCYRGGKLSYLIARRLVNVKYIALVNLIVDRPLIKELIQDDLTPENLKGELQNLLHARYAGPIREGYGELRKRLGSKGASQKAARLMVQGVMC